MEILRIFKYNVAAFAEYLTTPVENKTIPVWLFYAHYSYSVLFSVILITAVRYLPVRAGHAPQTTNKYAPTSDVHSFSFESAGVLEIDNEYSGLAVAPAFLYCLRRSQEPCPY